MPLPPQCLRRSEEVDAQAAQTQAQIHSARIPRKPGWKTVQMTGSWKDTLPVLFRHCLPPDHSSHRLVASQRSLRRRNKLSSEYYTLN